MYLSSIELVGFKSFASKTQLKFSSGLSAIVGPNGCGKSNVVDAMRWVLGEKKASALRSEQMDNLIFNGSKNRKPTSMAEVTLTIDNNKKILPIEYDQITVTRRLFRNGDSEFLLNKTRCRLKDIHSLFMDTGIGPDSYSVIELGMVEAILSGRVDERRRLFEEAAGIKKYKQRRKETQSRLNAVRGDMERLGDIVEEVRKNVASLQRQAAKTRRYNSMRKELEEIELLLFAHEYHKLTLEQTEADKIFNRLVAEKQDIERRSEEFSEMIQQQREELTLVETDFEKAASEEKQLIEIISERKRIIAVTDEKISSATGAEERLTNEINFAEETKQHTATELESNINTLQELEKDVSMSDEIFATAKSEKDQAQAQTTNLRTTVQSARSEIMELQHQLNVNVDSIRHLDARRTGVENTLKKLQEQSREYQSRLSQIEEKNIETERNAESLDIQLSEKQAEYQRANEEKITYTNTIEQKKNEIENLQAELSARKASLVFLEGIQAGGESVKFLAKNDTWGKGKDWHLLEEIIDIDDEYKTALHAALGDAATAFIVDSAHDAFDGMELLKSSKKGKAGFIAINAEYKAGKSAPNLAIAGVLGNVRDLVKVGDKQAQLVTTLLADTYLTNSRQAALDAIKAGAAKAVTIEGEVFFAGGLIHGGSKNKSEGIAVGRKVKIQNLQAEIETLEEKISDCNEAIANAKEEIQMLDIPQLETDIREIEKAVQKNQADISRLEMDREAIERNADMNEDNVQSYNRDLEKILDEKKEKEAEKIELIPRVEEAENKLKEILTQLSEAEKQLAYYEEQLRSAEMAKLQMQADINQMRLNIERQKKEIQRITNSNNQKRIEIENAAMSRKELRETFAINQLELDKATEKIGEVQSKKEIAKEEKTLVAEQIEHNRMSAGALQKDANRKNENVHRVELNLNELKVKINYLVSRARESYELELSSYEAELSESFAIQEATGSVNELKDKLSKLGNINFQALEEYEIQQERLEFSETQMADLIESEVILNDTIFELNTKAEAAFKETYDKIRANFKMLFNKLFGGEGEADLRLVDDDLLESDIEITARPPGKRPHSIDMLSGGEKTLTAIALLFAIYLVKPSPFCILDEVDAPLDDKNLEKYLDMIIDFSKETQFLLVTHNKKTMAAASNLYGITMPEQGVSKVVAVNIEQE